MSSKFSICAFLGGITILAALYPSSHVLAESTMIPPESWHHTKIVVETYTSPNAIDGFTPSMNILSDNLTIDQELSVLRKRLKSSAVPLIVDKPITCSEGQRAESIMYTSALPTGVFTIRQLILQESTGTKVITYAKPAGTKDDPGATLAMQSVCNDS